MYEINDGRVLFVVISTVGLLLYDVISSYRAMRKKKKEDKIDE